MGRKRSKMVVKLSWAKLARSIIAAISAEALPTFFAVTRWAAVAQNTTPKAAVPPEDSISAMAFPIRFPAHGRLGLVGGASFGALVISRTELL
jgi:hypothetical protein